MKKGRNMKRILLLCILVQSTLSPCFGFELIVLGDSRSDFGNEYFQKTEEIINDAVAYTENNYDDLIGVVMTGDYVNSGRNSDEWEMWKAANVSAFTYPVYPCLGNHDDESTDCFWWDLFCQRERYYNWNYYKTFNVERWWSQDIEGLHLVALDSNLAGFELNTFNGDLLEAWQYRWFIEDLARNRDKPTIVIWHEPAYGSHSWFGKGHGSNRFMRQRYVSLCETYGVKMIMYGHNHWYERVTVNGIKHITTGGGGAPQAPVSPLFFLDRVEGSQVNKAAYHWCVLSVNEEAIKVDVIRHKTHRVLDSFVIPY